MAGGISFETPEPNVPLKRRIPRFRLHADRDAAQQKRTIVTIKVDRADGLRSGTPIRFTGLAVGKIEDVALSADMQSILPTARITEVPARIARVGPPFWVVKADLGLVKTSNVEELVTGQYNEITTQA